MLLVGSVKTAAKLRRLHARSNPDERRPPACSCGRLPPSQASELALERWGVIAFALNYIPVIGPLIATVFPTLFAMAQFASWQTALTVFACLNLIQFLIGSYLEPRVAGSALSISPSVVLFAVFFRTFPAGDFRRLHRRADHDCGLNDLRAAPLQPLGRRSAGISRRPAGLTWNRPGGVHWREGDGVAELLERLMRRAAKRSLLVRSK